MFDNFLLAQRLSLPYVRMNEMTSTDGMERMV